MRVLMLTGDWGHIQLKGQKKRSFRYRVVVDGQEAWLTPVVYTGLLTLAEARLQGKRLIHTTELRLGLEAQNNMIYCLRTQLKGITDSRNLIISNKHHVTGGVGLVEDLDITIAEKLRFAPDPGIQTLAVRIWDLKQKQVIGGPKKKKKVVVG